MDPINQYKTEADTASKSLADMQGSAPGMLAELKKNLVGIFSKDNPIIAAREIALSDYLSSPDRTRSEILPINLPSVEGSNLTLSPTQQNAVTSARQAAALAPLYGLNQIITGQYGTIGDIVQGAGTAYGATIDAQKARVATLLDLYKTAVAEEDSKRKAAQAGSGGLDIAAIIAAIRGANGGGADPRGDISQFDEPDGESDFVMGVDPLTGEPMVLPNVAKFIPPIKPKGMLPATSLQLPSDLKLNLNSTGTLNLGNYTNGYNTQPGTISGSTLTQPYKSPFSGLGLNIDLKGGSGYGF